MELVWTAPGPGRWERDDAHINTAPSTYFGSIFYPTFSAGFAAGFKAYGIPLAGFDIRMVNGWHYFRPRAVGAPERAIKPPPKLIFKLLFALHPEMRRRTAAATAALASKLWRQDLAAWLGGTRAEYQLANRALQAIDPTTLDDAALRAHIATAEDRLVRGCILHFRHFPTQAIPLGGWLRKTADWTGEPPRRALAALAGLSPASSECQQPQSRLVEAIRDLPNVRDALANLATPAADRIAALRAGSPEVARAWDDYIQDFGHRIVTGFDLLELTALELPELLLASVTSQLDAPPAAIGSQARDAATAALRDRVPAAHRDEFDALLEEARVIYGLRDDDVGITFSWPEGLLRRALRAAGARLVERGVLTAVDHVFDCEPAEALALLGGPGAAPTGAELAARGETRRLASLVEAPRALGAEAGPPPLDWFPPPCAEVTAGMMFARGLDDTAPPPPSTGAIVIGIGASGGVYEGRARIVHSPSDFASIAQGDVLVAMTTSPAYNVVLPLLGAVVTDRGGALSHAAVVARELGIPAVVGTMHATTRIADRSRIRVDGDRGLVEPMG